MNSKKMFTVLGESELFFPAEKIKAHAYQNKIDKKESSRERAFINIDIVVRNINFWYNINNKMQKYIVVVRGL
jgi:hypothetical protein